MRLTEQAFRRFTNPEKRWLIFDCPERVYWSPLQAAFINENQDLLRDPNRPRRKPIFRNDDFDVARDTGADVRRAPVPPPPLFRDLNFTTARNILDEVVMPNPHEGDREDRPRVDEEELRILHHDLELRYANCYFIRNGSVGYAASFFIDKSKIHLEYYEVVSGRLSTRKLEKYDESFDFTLPRIGYVNCNQFSLFAERNYRRDNSYKYKRGFNDHSCHFYSVSDREIRATSTPYDESPSNGSPSLTKKVVSAIYLQQYPSYEEALESVLSFNKLSCAFSSTLCIKLDSLYNKFVLLKNTWSIAEFDVKTGTWDLLTNTFNEELVKLNIPFKEV